MGRFPETYTDPDFPDSRILISSHGVRKDSVQLQLGNLRRSDNCHSVTTSS